MQANNFRFKTRCDLDYWVVVVRAVEFSCYANEKIQVTEHNLQRQHFICWCSMYLRASFSNGQNNTLRKMLWPPIQSISNLLANRTDCPVVKFTAKSVRRAMTAERTYVAKFLMCIFLRANINCVQRTFFIFCLRLHTLFWWGQSCT